MTDLLQTLKSFEDGTVITVTNGLDARKYRRRSRIFKKTNAKAIAIANLFAGYYVKSVEGTKVIIKKE